MATRRTTKRLRAGRLATVGLLLVLLYFTLFVLDEPSGTRRPVSDVTPGSVQATTDPALEEYLRNHGVIDDGHGGLEDGR